MSDNWPHNDSIQAIADGAPIEYRVGFLGAPNSVDRLSPMWRSVPWTEENIGRLKALGFNTIQLNTAWGARPEDEPLNAEDVITLDDALAGQYPQPVPLNCDSTPERREQRRADLRRRSELCKRMGLRTLFHFGAPYNAHGRFGDTPPNCICDENTIRRHELLIRQLALEFPAIDDILIYTYDQDAWLCGEFGQCPRCAGVPLDERLPAFLDRLTAEWRAARPEGRLWWEPWELSAGQVFHCADMVNPEGFGLSLHANVAEVMATLPADRWLKNTAALAARRGIPVIAEYFLGACSEELEPLMSLSHPLVTLRGLKAIAQVQGVTGIKEYYGLAPDKDDPNLHMTGLFFANPGISESEALNALAKPYEKAAEHMKAFWRLASMGMELFPWETTWFIREIGRSRVDHALSAAVVRSQTACTPAWASTRKAIFMACVEPDNHPWFLEDIELRCEMAARRWIDAEDIGRGLITGMPEPLRAEFGRNLLDLGRIRRRAMAYAYHLRETNVAAHMRAHAPGTTAGKQAAAEMHSLLRADQANHAEEQAASPVLPTGEPAGPWSEIDQAITLLEQDPARFLQTCFLDVPDQLSKGMFSMTSR